MKNDKEINFGHVNDTTRTIRQTLLLGRDRFLISSNLTEGSNQAISQYSKEGSLE